MRAYFAANQRNPLAALGVVSHVALPAALVLQMPAWVVWLGVPGVALYAWVTFRMLVILRRERSAH